MAATAPGVAGTAAASAKIETNKPAAPTARSAISRTQVFRMVVSPQDFPSKWKRKIVGNGNHLIGKERGMPRIRLRAGANESGPGDNPQACSKAIAHEPF